MENTLKKSMSVLQLTTMAMFCVLAYVVMYFGRIPMVMFLKYDPKDVIIAIGGFIYGPFSAFIISVVVSFIEMLTASATGWIGMIMNILSTCSFVCVASIIYKKRSNIKGAVIGLLVGLVLMTMIMLLWNYFMAPIYMGVTREAVAALLVPVFLPFNLIKGTLNAAIMFLLYKPVVSALRKMSLVPPSSSDSKGKVNLGVIIAAVFVLLTCVLLVLVLQGVI